MPNKIGMISLGCAKNRVNSEQMLYLLTEAGYQVSGETRGADVVVVNTCGFIESAKTEAIDTILELAEEKKAGNIGAIIVAGCLPQRYKNILTQLPEADAALGTGSYDEIADAVDEVINKLHGSPQSGSDNKKSGIVRFGDINAPVSETKRIISTSHLWAYLKIADGCDNCCSYCCIPAIRGRFRSRTQEAIVDEAGKLARSGYKELILVAQDITSYGLDLYGRRSLTQLLKALSKIDNIEWIRLLYMYPDGFDDELVDEISNNDRIVKYLDIPIQHINDNILRSMNRRGTGADIKRLFSDLRERIDDVVLRTSLITGLPGEGQREFNDLCRFLRKAGIERAGVFAYSPEEGTPAAEMKRPGKKTAQHRAAAVRGIQSSIMHDFNRKRIGTTLRVLPEYQDGDIVLARSYAEAPDADGYIQIKTGGTPIPADDFISIKITGIEENEPVGVIVGSFQVNADYYSGN